MLALDGPASIADADENGECSSPPEHREAASEIGMQGPASAVRKREASSAPKSEGKRTGAKTTTPTESGVGRRARPQETGTLTSEVCRRLGATLRTQRAGPELDLVASFLRAPFFISPPNCEMAVFQEPRLPSGFPDVVLVFWRRDVVRRWSESRLDLTTDDIRLAHYLYQVGPAASSDLEDTLGRKVLRSLQRLCAAGIAERLRDKWKLGPLEEIFAVDQLIAIEAKVSEWSAGLEQAWLNTWFASESYLLLPRIPRGSAVLEQASKLGIGVCTDQGREVAPTCRPKLPASYVSWLFNEWVGRIPTLASADGERAQH